MLYWFYIEVNVRNLNFHVFVGCYEDNLKNHTFNIQNTIARSIQDAIPESNCGVGEVVILSESKLGLQSLNTMLERHKNEKNSFTIFTIEEAHKDNEEILFS